MSLSELQTQLRWGFHYRRNKKIHTVRGSLAVRTEGKRGHSSTNRSDLPNVTCQTAAGGRASFILVSSVKPYFTLCYSASSFIKHCLFIPYRHTFLYSPVGKVKRFLKIWKSLDHLCDILQISDTGVKEKFI